MRGRLQIVYGLLTGANGVPIAVEVFKGNTGDPTTASSQVKKIKERFGLSRVVLVGDRGMLTMARIDEDVAPAGLEWVAALRAPTIRSLAEAAHLQLSLFDQTDLVEISHPDFPGERLVACRNQLLAAAKAEGAKKTDAAGQPLHSLRTLLADLATDCLSRIQPTDASLPAFTKITRPTPLQRRAFELLQASPQLGAT